MHGADNFPFILVSGNLCVKVVDEVVIGEGGRLGGEDVINNILEIDLLNIWVLAKA